MAMMGNRDKPTFYKIVNAKGETVARASRTKVLALRAKMQKETGEKLEVVLIEESEQ